MDPYTFEFMVKDRIRELEGEAARQRRLAMGKKRHLTTWLTAVVHLWSPSIQEPASSADCEDGEHGASA